MDICLTMPPHWVCGECKLQQSSTGEKVIWRGYRVDGKFIGSVNWHADGTTDVFMSIPARRVKIPTIPYDVTWEEVQKLLMLT